MSDNINALTQTKKTIHMTKEKWQHLTEKQYQQLFQGSAVKRAKYSGLMRNINALDNEEL